MNTYRQFHGKVQEKDIGKELRRINKEEKNIYKILTGYGATNGICVSKNAAIKSLRKMRKEGLIRYYIPGEKLVELLLPTNEFYEAKMALDSQLKKDKDYGNDGVIYIVK